MIANTVIRRPGTVSLDPHAAPPPQTRVTVRAPGRLHLGFLDPSGSLGRSFGSIGLVIDRFETVVELSPSSADEISAAPGIEATELRRASMHLNALRQRTGVPDRLRLHIASALPAHAGFGSGTQLALAIGSAFGRLYGLDLGALQLAQWLGRGRRSGVGIAGFEQGGLLVDGGPGDDGSIAPLLARLAFPTRWRVLLVLDRRKKGLAGDGEARTINTLPSFPAEAAAQICHQTLMRILPGVAGESFNDFAKGVTQVQSLLGRHFAPAQSGSPFTSEEVGVLIGWIAASTTAAVGQSSWGPTGFAVLPSLSVAEALVRTANAEKRIPEGIELRIVQGRNLGATISVDPL